MPLQNSGTISLDQIHVEAGGTTGTEVSLNDSDIRGLIDKTVNAQNAFSEYYGASAETDLGDSVSSQINGQNQLHQITVSNYISSGDTLRVPSNLWVWTNSTGTAAMTIDIPCTIINDGKIIGCGGRGGGHELSSNALSGGPAINVTSSGVTIINSSGAYIAGGGGGGGGSNDAADPQDKNSGGGGGAGGGAGARGHVGLGGSGGTLNASGANAANMSNGGGAGGGSGGAYYSNRGGGGGGRILPGSGGSAGLSGYGDGGSAGNAGVGARAPGFGAQSSTAGGGGGWGASGANGSYGYWSGGASGGAAITGTSRTLSNSGTIYGST